MGVGKREEMEKDFLESVSTRQDGKGKESTRRCEGGESEKRKVRIFLESVKRSEGQKKG